MGCLHKSSNHTWSTEDQWAQVALHLNQPSHAVPIQKALSIEVGLICALKGLAPAHAPSTVCAGLVQRFAGDPFPHKPLGPTTCAGLLLARALNWHVVPGTNK